MRTALRIASILFNNLAIACLILVGKSLWRFAFKYDAVPASQLPSNVVAVWALGVIIAVPAFIVSWMLWQDASD